MKGHLRIDIGGTLDLPEFAFYNKLDTVPRTLVLPISLTVEVNMRKIEGGYHFIFNDLEKRYNNREEFEFGKFKLFEVYVCNFNLEPVRITVKNKFASLGLGSSGAVNACLAHLINKEKGFSWNLLKEIFVAHYLEHNRFSFTGFQDQIASKLRTITLLEWGEMPFNFFSKSYEVRNREAARKLSSSSILFTSFVNHDPFFINQIQVGSFISDPYAWKGISEIAKRLYETLSSKFNILEIQKLVNAEQEIRNKIATERLKGLDIISTIREIDESTGILLPGCTGSILCINGNERTLKEIENLMINKGYKKLDFYFL